MRKIRRTTAAVVFILCMFLLAACVEEGGQRATDEFLVPPPQNPPAITAAITPVPPSPHEGSTWGGFVLMRENIRGSHHSTDMPNNVITTECETLVVYYTNSSGSDDMQFGMAEMVQVQLDGAWYTLTDFFPPRDEPLILPHRAGWNWSDIPAYRHEIHLPATLPLGHYRLADEFFCERMQMANTAYAYFWVVEPGAPPPPQSMTTGEACMDDINLTVTSVNPARRQITDTDEVILYHIENISGREYLTTAALLERYDNGEWRRVSFRHINKGLTFGWVHWGSTIFLSNPLAPGDYRLTLTMNVFNQEGDIFPQYYFNVISAAYAPTPVWDMATLFPSPVTEIGTSVTMVLTQNIITRENPVLEIVLEANRELSFGERYHIEINIDGKWYEVPFASAFFHDIGLGLRADATLEQRTIRRNFVGAIGVVPPGQYRIVKSFTVTEFEIWEGVNLPTNFACEIAVAEFTVIETLGE